MNEGLEDLDDPTKNVGNPSGGLMWMRNCLEEWFCLELLRRIIARMISKASTNRTSNWPIETNQLSDQEQLLGKAKSDCKQITKNNCLARLANLAKAKTNWEAIDQTIRINVNIADGIRWGLELAKSLDQGLEIWTSQGLRTDKKSLWFRRLM